MLNMNLRVGDVVKLSPNTNWNTDGELDNPLDTIGRVDSVGEHWLDVMWSNGAYNTYKATDNDLIIQSPQHLDPDDLLDVTLDGFGLIGKIKRSQYEELLSTLFIKEKRDV